MALYEPKMSKRLSKTIGIAIVTCAAMVISYMALGPWKASKYEMVVELFESEDKPPTMLVVKETADQMSIINSIQRSDRIEKPFAYPLIGRIRIKKNEVDRDIILFAPFGIFEEDGFYFKADFEDVRRLLLVINPSTKRTIDFGRK